MSDVEPTLLIEALGKANTALSLARDVFQMLGERGLVPSSLLLELLDSGIVGLKEAVPHLPDAAVQIREHESLLASLRALPEFQVGPQAAGAKFTEARLFVLETAVASLIRTAPEDSRMRALFDVLTVVRAVDRTAVPSEKSVLAQAAAEHFGRLADGPDWVERFPSDYLPK